MRIIATLVFLAGCIEPRPTVTCGDSLCPPGSVCVASGCAAPDQLDACTGLVDGDACSVPRLGVSNGKCEDGACIVPACGNGRVEPGEACDDGNEVSGDGCNANCSSTGACGNALIDPGEECDCGDGTVATDCPAPNDATASDPLATCRADCRIVRCGNGALDYGEVCDDGNFQAQDGCTPGCSSDETCGNGVLDVVVGEVCEDGNTFSHDGCNNRCKPETLSWEQLGTSPPARWEAALAHDAPRARIVMFGGKRGPGDALYGDTWEWEASGWRQRYPVDAPAPRWGHAMVYDAARQRVVLFGGENASAAKLADTWEWDGTRWLLRVPVLSPSPRFNHKMVYDAKRGRVVLFGGSDGALPNNETWEWDGTNWSKRMPSVAPSPRSQHAMAYDLKRGVTVLFGGRQATDLNDVWEWDGTSWTDRSPTSPTTARRQHAMAYDSRRALVVVTGWTSFTIGWNGTAWTSLGTSIADQSPALAYVATTGTLVRFGGYLSSVYYGTSLRGESDTQWQTWSAPAPSPRTSAAMALDADRARLIVHGGYAGGAISETWSWDGAGWTAELNGTLGARQGHALVADPTRSRLVLFGGEDDSGLTSDETWIWDGAWTDAMETCPVVASEIPAAGRDRDGVIAFDASAATWRWNGTTWADVTPAMSPAPSNSRLTYDTRRERTVMAGDEKTWEWDGTAWTEALVTSPPARHHSGLAYDPLAGRTLLFAGGVGAVPRDDLWAWDGVSWQQLAPTTAGPSPRTAFGMAYDPTRSELVVFGGSTSVGDTSDVWALRWDGPDALPEEACHSRLDLDRDGKVGCDDPDCWPWCDPHCPPGTACEPTRAYCGDGTCSALEVCACPSDCGTCPAVCGDFVCDTGEMTTCPGDCP